MQRAVKRLAANPNVAIEEGASKKKGLLIAGHTGSGKSHLLRATTVAARENGVLAVFTETYRLMRRVKDSYTPRSFPAPGEKPPPTASEILENLAAAELLCLDDLGAEQTTEHNLQVTYELLDTLLSRGRTAVISTNLSPEGLRKNYGERIFSRISELARIVELRVEKDHRSL